MKINHIALYTNQLEKMKQFYETYFDGKSNEGYYNEKKQFRSYFITFQGDVRLEIMEKPSVEERDTSKESLGFIHMAFSVGSKENVERLTRRLIEDGYSLYSEPRVTGDGYFESCVGDPDGNHIEITI